MTLTLFTPVWVDNEILVHHSVNCGYQLASHSSGYYNILTQNDTLYYDNFHGANKNTDYKSAAFSYYNNCNNLQLGGCDYSTSLISKNTTNYTCGNPFYLKIEKKSIQNQLDFYPNPATNQITLKGNFKSITIYNNLGQMVFEQLNPNQIIEVNQLTKGLYFIKGIGKNDFMYTSKLIIE